MSCLASFAAGWGRASAGAAYSGSVAKSSSSSPQSRPVGSPRLRVQRRSNGTHAQSAWIVAIVLGAGAGGERCDPGAGFPLRSQPGAQHPALSALRAPFVCPRLRNIVAASALAQAAAPGGCCQTVDTLVWHSPSGWPGISPSSRILIIRFGNKLNALATALDLIGFALLLLMTLTLFRLGARRLGAANWRRLHKTGVYVIWFVATYIYLGHVRGGGSGRDLCNPQGAARCLAAARRRLEQRETSSRGNLGFRDAERQSQNFQIAVSARTKRVVLSRAFRRVHHSLAEARD